jgi:hypothetical protein
MESVLENVAAAGRRRKARPRTTSCGAKSSGAIRSLSPKLRDALLLAQSGEYSYDEIGTMLGSAGRHDQMARVRSAACLADDERAAGIRRCPMNGCDLAIDVRSTRSTADDGGRAVERFPRPRHRAARSAIAREAWRALWIAVPLGHWQRHPS